jgi:hypothetical protein
LQNSTKIIAVRRLPDTLDLKEVHNMFLNNDIQVEFGLLKELFKIVSDNPSSITLDQFKAFSLCDKAKKSK